MSERKVSEMSLEELVLYKEQLTKKISEVDFYLRAASKYSNLGAQTTSSQVNAKEEV